jgi:CHAT domain-containing protein/tetratricopeptide (TPR) repeat protein
MCGSRRLSLRSAVALGVYILAGQGTFVAVQDRHAPTSSQIVRELIDAGRYPEAEAAAEQLVSAAKAETGTESVETARATDLLVEALLRNGEGAQAATRSLAESVLRVKETHLKPDNVDLSPSLRNLAYTLVAAGDARQSLPLLERAVAINEQTHGLQATATADSLDDLAAAQIQCDRYDDARRSLERALTIKEASLGPSGRGVPRTLDQFALMLQKKGEYRGARPFLERSLHLRENESPDNLDFAETLALLGDQLLFEGDPQAARLVYIRVRDIEKGKLRANHPRVAGVLRNLAQAVTDLGDLTEAKLLQEQALAIVEKNAGATNPEITGYLNDLANTNAAQGDYAVARVLYERAIKIVEDRMGAGDVTLATYAYNLAIVHVRLGDLVEARRQFKRAIDIWQRVLGPDHPYVAIALSALGRRLADQGAHAEAQRFLERALKIRERSLGADHRDVARNLADLAMTLERQGQVSRAQTLSARAVSIIERSDALDIPSSAGILALHADLQARQGHFDSARQYYERALAIRARVLGQSHPDYAVTQMALASTLARAGESSAALNAALQAEETGRQHLRLTVRYLSERQSLGYAGSRPKGLDLAMSLLAADPDVISRVFDGLIKSRSLVLDEMAARRHVRSEESRPEVASLWTALASTRQRLANLVVRGPGAGRPEQYTALIEDARREKELAERALADKSAVFRDEIARGEIGLDDVRRALPTGSALVAFARYDRTPIFGAGAASSPATSTSAASAVRARAAIPSYIAFIVREGQSDIALVRIGSASSIDGLVSRWHAEIMNIVGAGSPSEAENTYRVAGAALRRRIWDPVAGYVKGATTVFVVPDGTLNLLSLAALPAGQTGYLIDAAPVIHYLSAERDLVSSSSAATANRGLLAVGGPAFDDATLFTGKVVRPRPATRATGGVAAVSGLRASCGDLASMMFDPLAGTLQEVREVARLWSDSPADILESRGASERAFKQAAPGHRVLHVATHGFFLRGACQPTIGGTRAVGGLSSKSPNQPVAGMADNPLLLSGLALAGANRRAAAAPGEDDGILTAEEVAALNLGGVEWAVLSACDTGLGEVKAGEGVFGLRRAFQIAGVRTVIMSLWSVDDQATRLWMRALYEGRLQKHLSTADAMHQASLSVLKSRRARGESTHPFYWAGFVAAGDWR